MGPSDRPVLRCLADCSSMAEAHERCGELAPMVSKAREELLALCTESHAPLWSICYPVTGLVNSPPSSAKAFRVSSISAVTDDPLKANLCEIISKLGEL